MLPISRGIPAQGSRGVVRAAKGRRKRVCRHSRKLLDKKSRSPKRASREKTARLQRIKAWIHGAAIPDSVNRTMLQRFRQESRCTGTLLDKKSKSPKRSRGRKKNQIL